MTAAADLAWYVYAVMPADAPFHSGAPGAATVLPGASIGQITSAKGLAAVVSAVPRRLFVAGDPVSRAEDPDWIAARASAHHDAIVQLSASAPCLPLGYGTMFGSADAVRNWLDTNAIQLHPALRRVAGQWEWSVTLIADWPRLAAWLRTTDPSLSALSAAAGVAAPGTSFLVGRRLARAEADATTACYEAGAARLRSRLEQRSWPLLLETKRDYAAWSVLAPVGTDVAAEFADESMASAEMGLEIRVTGPFPPYTFARAAWQPQQDV